LLSVAPANDARHAPFAHRAAHTNTPTHTSCRLIRVAMAVVRTSQRIAGVFGRVGAVTFMQNIR